MQSLTHTTLRYDARATTRTRDGATATTAEPRTVFIHPRAGATGDLVNSRDARARRTTEDTDN